MRRDLERISMPQTYGLIMAVIMALACITIILWIAGS
jgi:hypothetical protein